MGMRYRRAYPQVFSCCIPNMTAFGLLYNLTYAKLAKVARLSTVEIIA